MSGTRIGAEVRLLAREPDPAAALEQLAALGLAPALELGDGGHAPGLVRRALALLPDDGRRDLTALAAGWLNVPAARLEPLLDRLAFPAADRTVILRAAAGADAMARRLAHAASDSEIDRAIAQAPPEQVALAGALGAAEAAARWLERLRHIELEISGDDLAAAGVPRGPAIGAGLRAARAAKLDGTIRRARAGAVRSTPRRRTQPIACARARATELAAMERRTRPLRGLLPHVDRPRKGAGLWIRYTMLAPLAETGERATAALWFLVMDPRGEGSTLARKATVPIGELHAELNPFRLQIGAATLSDYGMSGAIDDVAWDLRWEPCKRSYEHVDGLLRRSGMAKTILVRPTPTCGWRER